MNNIGKCPRVHHIFEQLSDAITYNVWEAQKPGMFQSNWEGGCFRHVIPSLKLTASLPLKINGWKLEDAISFLGWPMFKGYV